MADVLVDQGQQPVLLTAGDDVTLPLHFTVKKTNIDQNGNVVIQKFDYQLQNSDTISVHFPPAADGGPEIVVTDIEITDLNRGKVLVHVTGSQLSLVRRGTVDAPATFKARILRDGKRSTFVFANLLVVKDDDFSPFQ